MHLSKNTISIAVLILVSLRVAPIGVTGFRLVVSRMVQFIEGRLHLSRVGNVWSPLVTVAKERSAPEKHESNWGGDHDEYTDHDFVVSKSALGP
jgi:hypothetical protein